MKNLIPLSDFVLEQRKKTTSETDYAKPLKLIFNYAEFLKQPLNLEMFVPCDEKGNVIFFNGGIPSKKKYDEYQEAKEKVLFEGFEVSGNKITDGVNDVYYMGSCGKYKKHCLMDDNVEYLVNWNLTLTPSALKKIGIKE